MNQRFKLLALEAGEHVNSVYTPPVRSKTPGKIWEDGHIGWNEKFQEKFAELIVRECVNKCDFVAAMAEITNTGEMARKTKTTANSCAQMIKQHFGVEE